jgi:hypothetical protein
MRQSKTSKDSEVNIKSIVKISPTSIKNTAINAVEGILDQYAKLNPDSVETIKAMTRFVDAYNKKYKFCVVHQGWFPCTNAKVYICKDCIKRKKEKDE